MFKARQSRRNDMLFSRTPFVLWPAPGLPLFLHAQEQRLSLIVASAGDASESLLAWAGSLGLRALGEDRVVPLAIERVEPMAAGEADPMVRGFASLPHVRRLSLAKIHARLPGPLEPACPASVALYDLVRRHAVERSRSVAVLGAQRDRLSLAFVSDLHLAAFWDVISAAVERHAPDLASRLLNPGLLLDRFIAEANRLWARGELDLVVLGGDLVDHVYAQSRPCPGSGPRDTNVQTLVRAMAGLRVPTIAIPGNHDYRVFPWRPRSYGLRAGGIPRGREKAILQAAGLWSRWPIRPSDLVSLRTTDDSGSHALSCHLAHLSPATDFAVTLHGLRLVFASTGRDAISQWRRTERARLPLLLRALRTLWTNPDSEGLYDCQVDQIAASLEGAKGTALFFHAPLLHAANGSGIDGQVGRLDLGDQDELGPRIALERRLVAAGVRHGVSFRNPGPLLRAMVSAPGPVVGFSGHVHHPTAVEVDRGTLAVRAAALAPPGRPGETVTLLTAPALGQQPAQGDGPPGYLLARFHAGALVGLERRELSVG